uniref:Uncharacterized protein n=1 Tax=Arundo donax TaxID=35708 RepID=A0A0A9B3B6_ARUDO
MRVSLTIRLECSELQGIYKLTSKQSKTSKFNFVETGIVQVFHICSQLTLFFSVTSITAQLRKRLISACC